MAVTLPPVPELTTVTSEPLQAKIREILPSQMGFGTDLIAQNVIVPIVDLTETAEGSVVREDLQTALAWGSQTSTNTYNTTNTLINNPGFFRIFGNVGVGGNGGTAGSASLTITDGITPKDLYNWFSVSHAAGQDSTQQVVFDFVVFLDSGISLTATTNGQAIMRTSTRQIADINGVLVNPSGFSPS